MDQIYEFRQLEKIVSERARLNTGTKTPRYHPYFDWDRMPKGSRIHLRTEQELYNLQVIDAMKGHAIIHGGKLFREPTPAVLDGAVCGRGESLLNRRVQIGMFLKVTYLEGEVILPGKVKSYDAFYESGKPFFLGRV